MATFGSTANTLHPSDSAPALHPPGTHYAILTKITLKIGKKFESEEDCIHATMCYQTEHGDLYDGFLTVPHNFQFYFDSANSTKSKLALRLAAFLGLPCTRETLARIQFDVPGIDDWNSLFSELMTPTDHGYPQRIPIGVTLDGEDFLGKREAIVSVSHRTSARGTVVSKIDSIMQPPTIAASRIAPKAAQAVAPDAASVSDAASGPGVTEPPEGDPLPF